MLALAALLFAVPQQPPTWQQDVSYRITARLEEPTGVLSGHQELRYRNRSPDTLRTIAFHLYLNAFRPASRWSDTDSAEGRRRFNDLRDPDYGFNHVSGVRIDGAAVGPIWPFAPDSTVVRFVLPRPLPPGDSLVVTMDWDARPSTVPRRQGRRGRPSTSPSGTKPAHQRHERRPRVVFRVVNRRHHQILNPFRGPLDSGERFLEPGRAVGQRQPLGLAFGDLHHLAARTGVARGGLAQRGEGGRASWAAAVPETVDSNSATSESAGGGRPGMGRPPIGGPNTVSSLRTYLVSRLAQEPRSALKNLSHLLHPCFPDPEPLMHPRTLTTILLAAAALIPVRLQAQAVSRDKLAVLSEVDRLSGEINRMAMMLWTYSETALKETRSAAFLADLAEKEGFTVERGVAGMPTAFVATWGSGSPVIGILAEYDALPGIGNEAVPGRQPRADGTLGGQGCGHNLFGAGSVGAAMALKRVMQARGIKGTIKLYGTPAEETLVGKTYMARDGLFNGLDATLEWHPATETGVGNTANQANNNFTVEFFGQPAHGAADPWNGRSALDAVELMTHAANMMREHVRPTARLHYVIPSAGEAPNVVPAYAKAWFFVRDSSRAQVDDHYAWLLKIAEGAALATRTTQKVFLNTGVYEYLFNRPLQEAMQKNLEAVGAPKWTEADQQFAREMQKVSGRAEKGLSNEVKPLRPGVEPMSGGSTDVADVSWINPTVGLEVATAGIDLPWHSWQTAASHGIPGASKAADVAAKVIAMTAVDLLTDPKLLAAAKVEFVKQRAGRPYQSAIPEGQKPPLP